MLPETPQTTHSHSYSYAYSHSIPPPGAPISFASSPVHGTSTIPRVGLSTSATQAPSVLPGGIHRRCRAQRLRVAVLRICLPMAGKSGRMGPRPATTRVPVKLEFRIAESPVRGVARDGCTSPVRDSGNPHSAVRNPNTMGGKRTLAPHGISRYTTGPCHTSSSYPLETERRQVDDHTLLSHIPTGIPILGVPVEIPGSYPTVPYPLFAFPRGGAAGR